MDNQVPKLTPYKYIMNSMSGIHCPPAQMYDAGYISIRIDNAWFNNTYENISDIYRELFGEHYAWSGRNLYWFRTKEDAVMFRLAYGE